jgi:MEMO1 family protein
MKRFGDRSVSPPVRPPAVAGRFYPADPTELRNLIMALLSAVPPPEGPAPKALIVPHAGYLYSGPIAASAYAQWLRERRTVKRIVLVGPAHYVAVEGLAGCSAEALATPLGPVPVDTGALRRLAGLPQFSVRDAAHGPEHALEVQLPFLQVLLEEFSVVPLVVGAATPEQVSEVLDRLWNGPETRLVVSSDLSHYLDYPTAREVDRITATAIQTLAPQDIDEDQACGRIPIRGLLQTAQARGMRVRTFDLRSSGDTAGSRDKVVGYGAFGFDEP